MHIRRVRILASKAPGAGWHPTQSISVALVVLLTNGWMAAVLFDPFWACEGWSWAFNSHFSAIAVIPGAEPADRSEQAWCLRSVSLASMDEPPLESLGADETYRLLSMPSFARTFAVRIERRGDRISLTAKRYPTSWPFIPRDMEAEVVERELDMSDLLRVRGALYAAEFWDRHLDPYRRGKDGEEWILEGSQLGGHRARSIWSPDRSDPQQRAFQDACQVIADLAGFL